MIILVVVVTMMVMMMKKIVMRLVGYGGWMDGWTFHQGLLPRMYEASLRMCDSRLRWCEVGLKHPGLLHFFT